MSKKTALNTLIELSAKNSDELAKQLGENLKAAKISEDKMTILLQYRQDYVSRLEVSMQRGIAPAAYRNFTLFISRLDDAIEMQKKDLSSKTTVIQNTKSKWQNSEKKRLSYSTLSNRSIAIAVKNELKRDQKESDEQASRISQSNRNSW